MASDDSYYLELGTELEDSRQIRGTPAGYRDQERSELTLSVTHHRRKATQHTARSNFK